MRTPKQELEELLSNESMTERTRDVLRARLAQEQTPAVPRFFTPPEFACLAAVAGQILAEPDEHRRRKIAQAIDDRLTTGDGKGWRYDQLPPDGPMYREGLARIDQYAKAAGALQNFAAASDELKRKYLEEIFEQHPRDPLADLFWEELLVDVIEEHYANPVAQIEIGARGMADVRPPNAGVTEVPSGRA